MYSFKPMGDRGLLVLFEQKISPQLSRTIQKFTARAAETPHSATAEIIPAYASICVIYNPVLASFEDMKIYCEKLLNEKGQTKESAAKVFEIPVLYNSITGPDLEFVARHNGLTPNEVIKIHTSKPYLIYMLGFAPGFCYLGGMDERIAAPRQQIPRQKITAGSVGIAGSQTGMYPIESPGGWQLIGITPLKLYDPYRNPPVRYVAGDYIRYQSIDETQFNHIRDLEAAGNYEWVTYPMEGVGPNE